MELVPNTENYNQGNSIIDDFNTLQLIIKRLGHRWKIVSKDSENEKKSTDIVNRDVVRQYVHYLIYFCHEKSLHFFI